MRGRKLLVSLVSALSLVLVTVPTGAADEPPPGAADVDKGKQFREGGSSYPRAIKLRHSGPLTNGKILVSTTTYQNEAGFPVFYESNDDGRSFRQISEIRDPAGENRQGMCCSTLYELPQQVGDMPAGTLLWAGTAGIGLDEEQRQSSIRLWRSDDHGKTWSYVSDIANPPQGPGVWEPEFTVSAQGDLVAFYSDDMDPNHDQKMVQTRSQDGVHWTEPKDTFKDDRFAVRPGMAGVRQLPNGTYLMTFEACNYDDQRLCAVYIKTSQDGWNWGDPREFGTEIKTDTGKYPMHTPTLSWIPGPGQGKLVLAYQILADESGAPVEGNGRTLLVNDDPTNLESGWREIPSPVQIKHNRGSDCRNFSPTVAPIDGGASVLHLTTDFIDYIGGPCELFYGTGPVDGQPGAEHLLRPQPLDPGRFDA